MGRDQKTALGVAAQRLREISLAAADGALLDSEEKLVAALGFSRSTIRQAARVLEREGLLRVRRGPSGGYFAARPDARTIENAVSSYLATLDVSLQDITLIASALWIEVVRKAARNGGPDARAMLEPCLRQVEAIDTTASFDGVRSLERECRKAVFTLADSKYVELIFSINTAFAQGVPQRPQWGGDEHERIVANWRDAKLMELAAIGDGDVELASLAARRVRKAWRVVVGVKPPGAA